MSYILEILNKDGTITTENFNKQIDLIRTYGLAERSVRSSMRSGNFINSSTMKYRVSEAEEYILSKDEIDALLGNISEMDNQSIPKKQNTEVSKDVYTAILLGDEHFSYEDKPSINIVYQFIEKHKYEIDEVLFGGDGIDASSLGKHLNLENEKHDLYSEMEAFKNYADKLKQIVPSAKFSIVEDNHYHLRKARFIAENPAMKNMIKDIKFDFDEISTHGKPYFPLHEYGNNIIAGIHGIFFNDVFTKNNTMNYPINVFQFHTHTIQVYKGNNGLISYGIPCLCKKEMAYLQGRPTRWENGFGILKYFPKENRYSIEYCVIKDNVGIYRDEVFKSE